MAGIGRGIDWLCLLRVVQGPLSRYEKICEGNGVFLISHLVCTPFVIGLFVSFSISVFVCSKQTRKCGTTNASRRLATAQVLFCKRQSKVSESRRKNRFRKS